MKTKSLRDRVSRSAELAVRARIHLDYFTFFKSPENIIAFQDALGEYWDFFRFTRLSHEWAFYIRINSLFTSRKDTDNLPDLLREVKQNSLLTQEQWAYAGSLLEKVNPIRKAVKGLRDKAIAHQDDTLSQPEVYTQAHLNLPKLMELSDTSLEIANCLCGACALPIQQFLPNQIEHLRAMLEVLRAAA